MAQWITRLSSKREVPGSLGKIFFFILLFSLASRDSYLDYANTNEINCDID